MKNLLVLLLLLFFSPVFAQYQTDVICAGFTSPCLGNSPSWKYWDQGFTMPDSANWKTLTTYNTTSWGTGNAPLGYDLAAVPLTPSRNTTIGYGDVNNKHRTSYFRKIITLSGYLDGGDTLLNNYPAAIYKLRVRRDDGIIVYINGRMVFRDGLVLPCGFFTYAIPSAPDNGNDWQEIYVDPHIFHIGDNIVAVELHQSSNTSNDLFFDLELKALRTLPFTQNTILKNTESWKYLHDNSDP